MVHQLNHLQLCYAIDNRYTLGSETEYGIDLMQRRIDTRVTGHHSPSTRTRLSLSFNGLELGLELELEKKTSSEQLGKLKMIIRVLIVMNCKCPVIGS